MLTVLQPHPTWFHYSVFFATEMMDVYVSESNGFVLTIYPQEIIKDMHYSFVSRKLLTCYLLH